MKYACILAAISLLILSCNNKTGNATTRSIDSIPSCLRKQIETFDKSSNAPVAIDEYQYKGKKTYLFTADCCDQFNTLYDDSCKAICSPSGGLEGSGDRQCMDFAEQAKLVKRIWTKPEPK